jgi:uncharacterized membrane protein
MPPHPPDRPNLWLWLRNSFATGVAIVAPLAVTIWLVYTVIRFVDLNVAPILPEPLKGAVQWAPGLGLLIALVALTLLGAVAGNVIGRILFDVSARWLSRLPVFGSIYGGARQVFGQVANGQERVAWKTAVLVQFPHPGSWTIGFLTNEETMDITAPVGDDLAAVFVPMTPIPTGGFLIYVRRGDLKPLPVSAEEGLKRVISFGILKPTAAKER